MRRYPQETSRRLLARAVRRRLVWRARLVSTSGNARLVCRRSLQSSVRGRRCYGVRVFKVGLATHLAALPLLGMILVIQTFVHPQARAEAVAVDTHLSSDARPRCLVSRSFDREAPRNAEIISWHGPRVSPFAFRELFSLSSVLVVRAPCGRIGNHWSGVSRRHGVSGRHTSLVPSR